MVYTIFGFDPYISSYDVICFYFFGYKSRKKYQMTVAFTRSLASNERPDSCHDLGATPGADGRSLSSVRSRSVMVFVWAMFSYYIYYMAIKDSDIYDVPWFNIWLLRDGYISCPKV